MSKRLLFLPGAGGDPAFWRPLGERLRSLIPRARLHVVPGCDHGFVEDRPEAIRDVIRDHLA